MRASDRAWIAYLSAKKIDLSAADLPVTLRMDELEALGGLQARRMLSMNERRDWPFPLREHGVFPLAISTKEFVLLRGDGWFDFPEIRSATATYEARLPFNLVSAMLGSGENGHIMQLENSGFLAKFLGVGELRAVFSGRTVSPAFAVLVNGTKVRVEGAQIEVDHQYEGRHAVVPIEAKSRHTDSCSIRQVYYPWRSLGERSEWLKPVRSVYVTYDKKTDDYILRELTFRRKEVWESIDVVHDIRTHLVVTKPPANLLNLGAELLENTRVPQADAPRRIEEFPFLVRRGISRPGPWADYYGLDSRQSNYYRDASQILGLTYTDQNHTWRLTDDGRWFCDLEPQKRRDELARRMCRVPFLHFALEALDQAAEKGVDGTDFEEILSMYVAQTGQKVGGRTLGRRAGTLRAWLSYIGSRTGAIVKVGSRFYLRDDVPNLDRFL